MKKTGFIATLATAAGLSSGALANIDINDTISQDDIMSALNIAASQQRTPPATAEQYLQDVAFYCEEKLMTSWCQVAVVHSNQNMAQTYVTDLALAGFTKEAAAVAILCPTENPYDWEANAPEGSPPRAIEQSIDAQINLTRDCRRVMIDTKEETGIAYNQDQFDLMSNYPIAVAVENDYSTHSYTWATVQALIFEYKQ